MIAMILAAGSGTRLAPLTLEKPKALVEFQGVPMIELILRKLRHAGFSRVVVNVHHQAEQMIRYMEQRHPDGLDIQLSDESMLLDTGGGIRHARPLLGSGPVLFHNVDMLTDLDISRFWQSHQRGDAGITLAVKDRETSRSLLFTPEYQLAGWTYPDRSLTIISRETRKGYLWKAFSGIYIMNAEELDLLPDTEVFSITPWLIERSAKTAVVGYDHSADLWFDLGRLELFREAEKKVQVTENGMPRLLK